MSKNGMSHTMIAAKSANATNATNTSTIIPPRPSVNVPLLAATASFSLCRIKLSTPENPSTRENSERAHIEREVRSNRERDAHFAPLAVRVERPPHLHTRGVRPNDRERKRYDEREHRVRTVGRVVKPRERHGRYHVGQHERPREDRVGRSNARVDFPGFPLGVVEPRHEPPEEEFLGGGQEEELQEEERPHRAVIEDVWRRLQERHEDQEVDR